jgi:hypothetical protein
MYNNMQICSSPMIHTRSKWWRSLHFFLISVWYFDVFSNVRFCVGIFRLVSMLLSYIPCSLNSSSIQNIPCCVSLLVMTWFYLRFRSPYTWTKSHFSVFAYSQKDQLLLLCKVNIDEKFDTWWMWRQMQNTQSNPHRHLRENFTSAHLKNRIKKRDKIPKSANWFDDVAPCASGVCSPMVKPVDPKWKGRYVHTEYQEQL